MVLESYRVPRKHTAAAAVFSYVILAGFIVLPGAFKSLDKAQPDSQAARRVYDIAHQIPIFAISGVMCLTGLLGTIFLWHKYSDNPVWLISNLST
jgi:hypothetical protein